MDKGRQIMLPEKKDILPDNRGVALIVVLTGITILAAFSSEFVYRSRIDITMASNVEKQVQAYFHARSAMEIARLVITSQKFVDQVASAFGGAAKSLELWRFACKFVEIFNTSSINFLGIEFMNLKGTEGIGVSKGGFSCEVIPEDSKINIANVSTVADRKMLFSKLYPLLRGVVDPEAKTGDDRKAAELILNIMDWSDPDDERSDIDSNGNFIQASGAGENVNYSRWGYRARNAKMDSVQEVRLVDGMTDELFCRFGDMLTVYNTEKLNVNEADLQLLKALLCDNIIGDPITVCYMPTIPPGLSYMDVALGYFETCRNIKRAMFTPAFMSEASFISFFDRLPEPLNQVIRINAGTLKPMIGTRSKVLRVIARGWVGGSGHSITAVIDTSSTNYLYWREGGFDVSAGL